MQIGLLRASRRSLFSSVTQLTDHCSFIAPPEFYYWDSYWIIEGLLLCDMHDTVKGMIENFLSMVDRFGFIPNGGRIYYLSRSQPPLLIPMVRMRDRAAVKTGHGWSWPRSLSLAFPSRTHLGEMPPSKISLSRNLQSRPLPSKKKKKRKRLPGRQVLRVYEGSQISAKEHSAPQGRVRILAKREDGRRHEKRQNLQDGALRG